MEKKLIIKANEISAEDIKASNKITSKEINIIDKIESKDADIDNLKAEILDVKILHTEIIKLKLQLNNLKSELKVLAYNNKELLKISEDKIETSIPIFTNEKLVSVPTGTITAFYGSKNDIPKGWVLCDGNNDTPNLNGRTIFGTTSETENKKFINSKNQLQLITENLPRHSHGYRDSQYNFSYKNFVTSSGSFNDSKESAIYSSSRSESNRETDSNGLGKPLQLDICPEHYKLFYIKKTN